MVKNKRFKWLKEEGKDEEEGEEIERGRIKRRRKKEG